MNIGRYKNNYKNIYKNSRNKNSKNVNKYKISAMIGLVSGICLFGMPEFSLYVNAQNVVAEDSEIIAAGSETTVTEAVTADAATTVEENGITYNYGLGEVTKCNTDFEGEVVIPQTVTFEGKAYGIRKVADNAFENCTGVTKVIFPENVYLDMNDFDDDIEDER